LQHRKKKVEPSQLTPRKLTANLEILIVVICLYINLLQRCFVSGHQ